MFYGQYLIMPGSIHIYYLLPSDVFVRSCICWQAQRQAFTFIHRVFQIKYVYKSISLFAQIDTVVIQVLSVLQPLIPDRPPSSYDPRPRTHDKLLLDKTTYLNDREFVIRMLYRDSYWLTIVYMPVNCAFFFFYSLLFILYFLSYVY